MLSLNTLRSHFMSSLYMCFYYTNVRTNGRYEFWVKNEYAIVGKIIELCSAFPLLDIIHFRDYISFAQRKEEYLKIQ